MFKNLTKVGFISMLLIGTVNAKDYSMINGSENCDKNNDAVCNTLLSIYKNPEKHSPHGRFMYCTTLPKFKGMPNFGKLIEKNNDVHKVCLKLMDYANVKKQMIIDMNQLHYLVDKYESEESKQRKKAEYAKKLKELKKGYKVIKNDKFDKSLGGQTLYVIYKGNDIFANYAYWYNGATEEHNYMVGCGPHPFMQKPKTYHDPSHKLRNSFGSTTPQAEIDMYTAINKSCKKVSKKVISANSNKLSNYLSIYSEIGDSKRCSAIRQSLAYEKNENRSKKVLRKYAKMVSKGKCPSIEKLKEHSK